MIFKNFKPGLLGLLALFFVNIFSDSENKIIEKDKEIELTTKASEAKESSKKEGLDSQEKLDSSDIFDELDADDVEIDEEDLVKLLKDSGFMDSLDVNSPDLKLTDDQIKEFLEVFQSFAKSKSDSKNSE